MGPSPIVTKLALCLLFAGSFSVVACCNSPDSGAGGGGVGAGTGTGGNPCEWDDGTSIGEAPLPDCSPYRYTAFFVGTLDGEHYDHLWNGGYIETTVLPFDQNPQTLSVPLPGLGSMNLEWERPTIWGKWLNVGGHVTMPDDPAPRDVLPGSKLRLRCGTGQYQYILKLSPVPVDTDGGADSGADSGTDAGALGADLKACTID